MGLYGGDHEEKSCGCFIAASMEAQHRVFNSASCGLSQVGL